MVCHCACTRFALWTTASVVGGGLPLDWCETFYYRSTADIGRGCFAISSTHTLLSTTPLRAGTQPVSFNPFRPNGPRPPAAPPTRLLRKLGCDADKSCAAPMRPYATGEAQCWPAGLEPFFQFHRRLVRASAGAPGTRPGASSQDSFRRGAGDYKNLSDTTRWSSRGYFYFNNGCVLIFYLSYLTKYMLRPSSII